MAKRDKARTDPKDVHPKEVHPKDAPKNPPDVTEAEFGVLVALWEQGPSTTRQLAERLYPERKGAAATVLKLLERLEAKQCVRRDDGGPLLVFSARVAREDLVGRRLDALADELCDGSRTPLLMHLVDPQRLTREERDVLRQLVQDLQDPDENPPRKKRR
jgi:predicted transcriptional regulator